MQHSRNRDLDGVRGLAVLLVVAAHAGLPLRWGGLSGVTLFFVLSGYLITSLLIREHDRYGVISLWRFWGRRALRLLPALLLLLAVVPVLLALTDPGRLVLYPSQALASLLYVGNYARIAGHDLGVLNHLWSLSVEEQFYVLWPTVVVVVMTWFRSRALSIVLALAGGATFYSVWTQGAAIRLDIATETNAFALLLGASLAFALAELRRRATTLPHASPLVPFLLLVALSAFPGHGIDVDHDLFRPLGAVFAVVSLWLVYAAVSGHARLVGSRFMVFFGTISYALYLWHQALINSKLLGAHTLGRNLVLVAAAIVVAWLSWVLVERPVGRLRGVLRLDQPSRRQAPAAEAEAAAAAGTEAALRLRLGLKHVTGGQGTRATIGPRHPSRTDLPTTKAGRLRRRAGARPADADAVGGRVPPRATSWLASRQDHVRSDRRRRPA